jgi:transcriptional regulator with XRE-family HTH domain
VKNRRLTPFASGKTGGAGRIRRKANLVMASTIDSELSKYGIGAKLRRLRLRKSMGLLELSKHTGLSPSLLSKLERDVMHPTLPTLTRIALVFSVGLEYFFNPEPRPVFEIVRKKDRVRFPQSPDAVPVPYYFESLDFPVPDSALRSYLAEFAEESSVPHEHAGIEFLYVLGGKLELSTVAEKQVLPQGDAVYFDSSVPHAYRGMTRKRTSALVVLLSA